jgi:3-oxoacyl-[acyl-carrier-protein] synthase II
MKVVTTSWNDDPRAWLTSLQPRPGRISSLAEGAYLLLFEEMEHALERGARIYGEVVGYGSTADAHHRVRLDETGSSRHGRCRWPMADAGIDARRRSTTSTCTGHRPI